MIVTTLRVGLMGLLLSGCAGLVGLAGGSAATVGLQWALAPNPVIETSVKLVCAGYSIWQTEHAKGSEPKWEAVLDGTCEQDPDSVAAAGADMLEAALMLELKIKGVVI